MYSKAKGDAAFRYKDFTTAIDCYTKVCLYVLISDMSIPKYRTSFSNLIRLMVLVKLIINMWYYQFTITKYLYLHRPSLVCLLLISFIRAKLWKSWEILKVLLYLGTNWNSKVILYLGTEEVVFGVVYISCDSNLLLFWSSPSKFFISYIFWNKTCA